MVRVKRRYIVFKFIKRDNTRICTDSIQETFIKSLRERIAEVYGDYGVACLNRGFSIKRHDPKEGIMVLMVRRGVHEMVMSVLPTLDILLMHLSGTIRGCLKHLKKDYLMNLRAAICKKELKNRAIKTPAIDHMECD